MTQTGTTIRIFVSSTIHELIAELYALDKWIPISKRAIPRKLPSLWGSCQTIHRV